MFKLFRKLIGVLILILLFAPLSLKSEPPIGYREFTSTTYKIQYWDPPKELGADAKAGFEITFLPPNFVTNLLPWGPYKLADEEK